MSFARGGATFDAPPRSAPASMARIGGDVGGLGD